MSGSSKLIYQSYSICYHRYNLTTFLKIVYIIFWYVILIGFIFLFSTKFYILINTRLSKLHDLYCTVFLSTTILTRDKKI